MQELAELSPKIKAEVIDASQQPDRLKEYGVDKLPAIVIESDGKRNVRLFGFPGGYEFSSFLQGLMLASKKESGLPDDFKQEVVAIDKPVHLQVFVTPN